MQEPPISGEEHFDVESERVERLRAEAEKAGASAAPADGVEGRGVKGGEEGRDRIWRRETSVIGRKSVGCCGTRM